MSNLITVSKAKAKAICNSNLVYTLVIGTLFCFSILSGLLFGVTAGCFSVFISVATTAVAETLLFEQSKLQSSLSNMFYRVINDRVRVLTVFLIDIILSIVPIILGGISALCLMLVSKSMSGGLFALASMLTIVPVALILVAIVGIIGLLYSMYASPVTYVYLLEYEKSSSITIMQALTTSFKLVNRNFLGLILLELRFLHYYALSILTGGLFGVYANPVIGLTKINVYSNLLGNQNS